MANQGTIKLGSWGGSGGDAWNWNPGSDSSIIEIVIRAGDVVDSLAFTSFNSTTEQETHSATYGGNGGVSHTISINRSSGEYLSLISGTTRPDIGSNVVGSLTFHTNKSNYGPYGVDSAGTPFNIPMENGKIVGFFGRAGDYVDALGIYVTPAN